MKILLTNDDGIDSKGIKALGKELSKIASIYIVAPEKQQSTTSHSLTLHKPLRITKVKQNTWKVNGTPIDCVKMGVRVLLKNKVDMVISGINLGANLCNDVLYSGTVAGAFEATQMGIPSLAVSMVIDGGSADYNFAAQFVRRLIKNLKQINLPSGTFLNINIPGIAKSKIKGSVITKLGSKKYKDLIEERRDLQGRNYYWLSAEAALDTGSGENADIRAVAKGHISITPVKINLTDYETFEWLKQTKIS